MKKLFLILFVITSLSLNAQYVTNHAKNINSKETDGYYYHLPRNIIRIDFEVEKEQSYKGKYSSFAKEMLNTDNYIKENSTSFRIKSVNVNLLTEADPDYVFFISAADEKTRENLNIGIELTAEGIIQSFGYKDNITQSDDESFSYKKELDYNERQCDYNYISIREDDMEDDEVDENEVADSKMTEKEIASSIIEEIKNVRIAYFDLISGYQEVNYGNTINIMLDELKKLENEYLNMFLGTTSSRTFTKTFYVIPEEGKNSLVLSKFSDLEGFNNKVGDNIKIVFTDSSIGPNVNKLSNDDIENSTHTNKMFYRNPANVTMQVIFGENKIFEERVLINQFGNVILVPINKMKLVFDTNTGQILSIIKE